MVRLAKYIIAITVFATGISATNGNSNNAKDSSVVNESISPENIYQEDIVLHDDGFFQDFVEELGNFFNNIFGEESYLSQESSVQVEDLASEAPANIKRAVFDMNALYSEEVAPEPSSNVYYDATQPTNEANLQEQKEKMAFNLAMTFKNAAKKKTLSTGMPSTLSRLLEKRGYYKSHKRFTRSIKDLPIEDSF